MGGQVGHDVELSAGVMLGQEIEGDGVVDGEGDDLASQGAHDHVFAVRVELQTQEGVGVLHVLGGKVVAAHADNDRRGGKIRYGVNVELVQDEKRQGVINKPGREVEIGAAGVRIENAGVEVGPSLADGFDRLVEIVEQECDFMAVSRCPEPPELDKDPLRLAILACERERWGISLGGDDEGPPVLRLCSPSLLVRGRQGGMNKGHDCRNGEADCKHPARSSV